MSRLLTKFILSVLTAFIFMFSFAPYFAAKAATQATQPAPSSPPTWYDQDFTTWYAKVTDSSNPSEIFGERYTSAQVEWVIYGLFAFVINHSSGGMAANCAVGTDVNKCLQGIGNFFSQVNKTQGSLNVQNKSWAELLFPADRQLSAVAYVRNKINDFSVVPTAHAQTQGFGFSAFNPVVDVWRSVRDFSFLLAIIATVILAFMIMFRVKISPQAVITAQSAIPKVIVGLIFVAFSYAIAGLLVDLMYLLIGLVSLFFNLVGNPKVIFDMMTNGPLGLGAFSLMGIYLLLLMMFLILILGVVTTGVASSGFGIGGNFFGALSAVTGGVLGTVLTFIILILVIVVAIVLLLAFFKIFWLMIKTLAQIYLLVIFGPLQIIAGVAMPSSGALGFGAWAKALFSNLIVYPVVGALFMLSFVFVKLASDLMFAGTPVYAQASGFFTSLGLKTISQGQASGWTPPLTFGGGAMLPLIFIAVSFVIITIVPKTTELIQSIMSGKPFGFGTAIGEATGVVQTGARGYGQYRLTKFEQSAQAALAPGEKYTPEPWVNAAKSIFGFK